MMKATITKGGRIGGGKLKLPIRNNQTNNIKLGFSSFKTTNFQSNLYTAPHRHFFRSTPINLISDELRQALLQLYKIPIDARVPNYKYDTSPCGDAQTKEYEVKVVCSTAGASDFRQVSPWMDISLYYFPPNIMSPSKHFPATITSTVVTKEAKKPISGEGNLVHMVCEIPKGTNAKLEVNLNESYHSIKQDIDKSGNLRFIKHGNLPFNYGMLPQTFEDPKKVDSFTGLPGDGDPVDVVEIGGDVFGVGEVVVVKPLGALALIDEGQTDWKIIAINSANPISEKLNDINDVEEHMPGLVDQIREWYRVYKVAEGKPENSYSFDGKVMSKDFTDKLIFHFHKVFRSKMIDTLANFHNKISAQNSPYQSYDPKLDIGGRK